MGKTAEVISPIAIDLGAKNTGVYYAHYEAGAKLSAIEGKEGEVLKWDHYTSLLKNRTKNRHIQRNYQRRKLAKRLFTLILKEYFDFSVKDHKQALGFFLNRRGYNRLDSDYSKELIDRLPNETWNALPELLKGSRNRNSFFKEIKKDLQDLSHHKHLYLKNFGDAISNHPNLDINKIFHLMAHISNFELKPLRAYFNDKAHLKSDQWDLKKISHIFEKWILNQWRVSLNDGEKKKQDYEKLKSLWKEHKEHDDVVSFWLKICPNLTIPPYQDIKNRRPPRCQTLLLNQKYIDVNYPQWQDWLKCLEKSIDDKNFLKTYQNKLKDLKSQKKKSLVTDDEINLRKLQFILDQSKDLDSYGLNEIWSTYHQLHQPDRENHQENKEELRTSIDNSALPDDLKQDLLLGIENQFEKKSFGHFINKYYQTRRKSRDGRYFLHQSKKNKWLDADSFLKICTHKPRQKKYQLLYDLAAILGIEIDDFKQKIKWDDKALIHKNIEAIETWFAEIVDGRSKLKSFCKEASDIQKKYRGSLKYKINMALKQEGSLKKEESKELVNLDEKSKNFSKQIANKLWPDKKTEEQNKYAQRFKSVFSFAQIYNILFKDRNGFSKICPVCSLDNSKRMEIKDKDDCAYACRLSGLSVRLIDGAVMRIFDRLSNHIVHKRWPIIKMSLEKQQKVCIPLIMEQNRFAFESTLEQIKSSEDSQRKKLKEQKDDRETDYNEKIERIKKASQGICPYTGESLINSGEIDHIIPQASKHGTLNDEANLIYVSKLANAGKTDTQYDLSRLSDDYKEKVFKLDTDEKIKEYIYINLIGEGLERKENIKNKTFIFGRYQNFVGLNNDDQRKAFRHALFLKDDPIKEMVINAISNRNRTIVNGTQRYLAGVLADKFHQKAKQIGKQSDLSFDYFEYTAEINREKSIHELRNFYLEQTLKKSSQESSELEKNSKERGVKQTSYSHLLDAQMAFLLACNEHRDNGTMSICFDKKEETVKQGIDDTGEILPLKYFKKTYIPEKDIRVISISRKKSSDRPHRSYTRDSFYADHYLPLLFKKENEKILIKAGFDWDNSIQIIELKLNNISNNKKERVPRFGEIFLKKMLGKV